MERETVRAYVAPSPSTVAEREAGVVWMLSGATRKPGRTCCRHSSGMRLSTTVKEASEVEREIRTTSFSMVGTLSPFCPLEKLALSNNNAGNDQRWIIFMDAFP